MAPAPAPASSPAPSDVPLALWPCAQPDPHQPTAPGAARALLPKQLAGRIVTEYTPPGALLVGPACPTLLEEAARLGRHAVALTCDPARARQTSTMLDLTLPAHRRSLAQIRRGSPINPEPIADLTGKAHALVTVNFDGHGQPAATADPASLAACAALLRPGGLLITVSRNQHHAKVLRPGGLVVVTARPWRRGGVLFDFPGALEAAAEQAGLVLVERAVALLAGLRGERLVPRASFFALDNTRKARAAGLPVHVIAHEDVLAFQYQP